MGLIVGKGIARWNILQHSKLLKGKSVGLAFYAARRERSREIGKLILVNSKYSLTGVQRQRDGRD